jgi:hypothetical protein
MLHWNVYLGCAPAQAEFFPLIFATEERASGGILKLSLGARLNSPFRLQWLFRQLCSLRLCLRLCSLRQ